MPLLLIPVTFLLLIACLVLWQVQRRLKRQAYIRSFEFPPGLFDQLRKQHPALTLKECQLVAQGLRQFFMAYLRSGRQPVSMPSQVADDLWHAFILYTKHYQTFCQRAFGRFLHHTPAIVLGGAAAGNVGLRRCWWHACREENINPRAPTRLPLLFALDAKLKIPNGFRYVADCASVRRQGDPGTSTAAVYCGGDFSSSSVDGGTDGFGDGGGGGGGGGGEGGGGDGGGGGCGGD